MEIKISPTVQQVNTDIWNLASEVEQIMSSGNIPEMQKLINEKKYLSLDQETKQRQVFYVVVNTINTFGPFENGIKILNYLIFDYNIKEEDSLNCIPLKLKKHVEPMFATRQLNQELTINENHSKKFKV